MRDHLTWLNIAHCDPYSFIAMAPNQIIRDTHSPIGHSSIRFGSRTTCPARYFGYKVLENECRHPRT